MQSHVFLSALEEAEIFSEEDRESEGDTEDDIDSDQELVDDSLVVNLPGHGYIL